MTLFALYFLVVPPMVGVGVAAWLDRRLDRGERSPGRYQRLRRWYVVPWLLYAANVVAFGGLYAEEAFRLLSWAFGTVGAVGILIASALLPGALLALPLALLDRSIRRWTATTGELMALSARGWGVHTLALSGHLVLLWLVSRATTNPLVLGGVALVALTIYGAAYPYVLRWVWRTRPLEAGPTRERIEGVLRRGNVPVRAIHVVAGRRIGTANALVSGLGEAHRHLFLTDYLLDELSPAEIEAVVAHEAGHLSHRHLARMTGALLASGAGGLVVWGVAATRLGFRNLAPRVRYALLGIGGMLLAGAMVAVVRWLGRRFELEADDWAVRLTGAPETLASALARLADLNFLPSDPAGADRLAASHPAIARRIRWLTDAAAAAPAPPDRSGTASG